MVIEGSFHLNLKKIYVVFGFPRNLKFWKWEFRHGKELMV